MAKVIIDDAILYGIADAIREKTGTTDTFYPSDMAAAIEEITGGGGSSADVKYVTFMSYDGATTYGVKPTATGDDCADPIARGLFAKPTKASTASQTFAHNGWATEAGGAADSNALKAITEDRVLYAAFKESVRKYTITYKDSDGSTLSTVSMAYGSTPSYTPSKDGYNFAGWEPEVVTVTGDATYTAKWNKIALSLADYTWEQLAAMNSAQATQFGLGDTKEFTVTDDWDKTNTFQAMLIGVNHDDKADGTGKAKFTFRITPTTDASFRGPNSLNFSKHKQHIGMASCANYSWPDFDIRSYAHDASVSYYMINVFPDEIKSYIKTVKKRYCVVSTGEIKTSDDMFFIESLSELGYDSGYDEGDCYPIYTSGKSMTTADANLIRNEQTDTTPSEWWTRSKFGPSYVDGAAVFSSYTISATGLPTLCGGGRSAYTHYCFCI